MDAFDLARNAANKASPQTTKYRHASVILDRNGKVIATGKNHFAGRIITSDDNEPLKKTVHSEIAALRKVNIRRLEGATIVNYARTNVAAIMARPCDDCWPILERLGFKKAFYTIRSELNKPIWREERFS